MKKILLATIMLLFVVNVSAQDSLQVVKERINELVSLTKEEVKTTGNKIIDAYTDSLYDLTDEVVGNGKDLNTLLEGVKNGAITKATALLEASSLSTKITNTLSKAKNIYSTAKEATKQIKKLKGLSLKTLATKTLSNNTLITKILGEETLNQVQTITSLVSELKK